MKFDSCNQDKTANIIPKEESYIQVVFKISIKLNYQEK
jgi:hypothetical protein